MSIENSPDDYRAKRCGHNFDFADCPYVYCEGRQSAAALDEARAELARLQALPGGSVAGDLKIALARFIGQREAALARIAAALDVASGEIEKHTKEERDVPGWAELALQRIAAILAAAT